MFMSVIHCKYSLHITRKFQFSYENLINSNNINDGLLTVYYNAFNYKNIHYLFKEDVLKRFNEKGFNDKMNVPRRELYLTEYHDILYFWDQLA